MMGCKYEETSLFEGFLFFIFIEVKCVKEFPEDIPEQLVYFPVNGIFPSIHSETTADSRREVMRFLSELGIW